MAAAGRLLPPEWAPQSAVMLTWPHEATDWAPWLDRVEPVFEAIAAALAPRVPLLVLARDGAHRAHVAARLRAAGVPPARVRWACVPSDDAWARDHGPLTVLEDGGPRLLDFRFNGWGGKFRHGLDDRIPAALHAAGVFGDTPLERVELVLEGGAIDTDGAGTLLTTRRCLLSEGRNGALGQPAVEAALRSALGAHRVLWLEHGWLAGDDTDGHVDMLARFCGPEAIAHVVCEDPADPHHGPLRALAAELAALRTPGGQPYRLVPLPLPRPLHGPDGARLPATYANFLVTEGAVLVPAYGDPADELAARRLARCFPGREVVPVPCTPLLWQGGSLHCVTMQLPRPLPVRGAC